MLPEPPIATTPLPPKLGALKFGWLRMLKNYARNSVENRSVMGNFLNTEKSRRWKPGPGTWPSLEPRAAALSSGRQLAIELGSGAITPDASDSLQGWLKAAALLIQNGRGPPSIVFVLMPSWASPVLTTLQPVPAVVPVGQPKLIGWPPCNVVIQFTAQPPRTASAIPPLFMYFWPLPTGNWYPPLKWNTLRRSKFAGDQSNLGPRPGTL